MKIYICTLKRSEERLAPLVDQISSMGINYELVYGIDGRSEEIVNYSDALNQDYFLGKYKRKLKSTEVACTLSHRKMLQRFVDSQELAAIFLEDDAFFVEDPSGVFNALVGLQYDMVVLGYPSRTRFESTYSKLMEPIYSKVLCSDAYKVGRSPQKKNFGLMAYYLSRDAALSLLNADKVWSVADDYDLISSQVSVLHIRPYLCFERRNVLSSINSTYRNDQSLHLFRRAASRLLRGFLAYVFLEMATRLGFEPGYKIKTRGMQ
ncbi:MAG: glycosyltransferase family 25 protein [Moraxellaceae bacterium]|nr:glycosyltransferase family 25 protein [Moraxellaceae bacterium]MDZ4386744.1 glycosyltransferase family 25 protein [Moraxellaceae bacterium]